MAEHVDDAPDDDDSRGRPLRDRLGDAMRRARRSSSRRDGEGDEDDDE